MFERRDVSLHSSYSPIRVIRDSLLNYQQRHVTMNRTLSIALTAVAALLIVVLLAGAWLLIRDELAASRSPDGVAVAPAETVAESAPATETATAVPPPRELPAPVIEVLPTGTPLPTSTPTETPLPTETPAATETPLPTATNTPVPVVIRATNTPVPPTEPPPPTAVPQDTRGLSAAFSIEGGPGFSANQEIWFNFTVSNASGGPVYFDVLGVYPKKDGHYRPDLIQASWGGSPTDAVPAGGLTWRDNIKIPESGNYTLQLAICFDAGYQACRAGGGTWIFLSGDIPITVH
jgi:hypothetical protein